MKTPLIACAAAILAVGVAAAPAQAATSYTAKDVAKHASAKSCWSSINGSVYDLTTWVNRHPGGARVIQAICGKDGSKAFNGKHRGAGKPAAQLKQYRIGALKK